MRKSVKNGNVEDKSALVLVPFSQIRNQLWQVEMDVASLRILRRRHFWDCCMGWCPCLSMGKCTRIPWQKNEMHLFTFFAFFPGPSINGKRLSPINISKKRYSYFSFLNVFLLCGPKNQCIRIPGAKELDLCRVSRCYRVNLIAHILGMNQPSVENS